MLMLLVRTILVYALILLLMRIMGKRHLGEMQPSELASTILISNLASVSIETPDMPLLPSLLPVLLIVIFEILLSAYCFCSEKAYRIVSGKPVVVLWQGKIDQQALYDLRLNIRELLAALRTNGVFDPSNALCAVMETSGTISVFAKPECSENRIAVPLILDGEISKSGLERSKISENKLYSIIKAKNCKKEEIFLMLKSGPEIKIIKKEGRH